MKFKKLLLGAGTLATIVAPIATVVSCGSDSKTDNPNVGKDGAKDGGGSDSGQTIRQFNLLPTYTGQADQLIALGIHADYYPEQLNVDHPYDYLTDPGKYMTQQTDEFKGKFQKALAGLMPETKGVSWWNQDALASDDSRISNTYWQKQEGSVLLYEHYLLDDDSKVINSAWAPKHHSQTALQTNFRASRDPYTRIPKGVFFGWDLSDATLKSIVDGTLSDQTAIKLVGEGKDAGKDVDADASEFTLKTVDHSIDVALPNQHDNTTVNVDKASAKIILAMRAKHASIGQDGTSDWFYNDWFFVDSFHRTYLDNADFQNSKFAQWMLDSTTDNPFEAIAADGHDLATDQKQIKELFDASTFQGDEVKAGLEPISRAKVSAHHPIYEQQEGEVGAAPMFEGAMRDNQLYLFNVAWQIQNLATTGTPYGKSFVDSLPEKLPDGTKTVADFSVARSKEEATAIKNYVTSKVTSQQLEEMSHALDNANLITDQLHSRMAAMKEYFNALGVNGKTFGLMTIAPGKGVSTLQTMSKFSFIYKELGFAQPTPKSLSTLAASAKTMTNAWVKTGDNSGTNPYLTDGVVKTADSGVNAAIGKESLFNMDDNGWFWTLGESGKLSASKLDEFKGTLDLGVVASRDTNFEAEVKANSGIQEHLATMFKGYKANSGASSFVNKLREHADYDLWNEGLKTPFVMDMLLDQIMTKSEEWYLTQGNTPEQLDELQKSKDVSNKYASAKDWGEYFTNTFVKDVE